MIDRLTIAFKVTRGVLASLKSLPGHSNVSYSEMYSVYADVTESLTGYREEGVARSNLGPDSLDIIESDVRRLLGISFESMSAEDLNHIQLLVMETVSQAETISKMSENVSSRDLEVPENA